MNNIKVFTDLELRKNNYSKIIWKQKDMFQKNDLVQIEYNKEKQEGRYAELKGSILLKKELHSFGKEEVVNVYRKN